MKQLIAITLLVFSGLSLSATHDDEGLRALGACLVAVDDANSYKLINVNYIRLLKLDKTEKGDVVRISMASNYFNGSTDGFNIKYNSPQEARKAMDELGQKINGCRNKT